jgi:hypothetical protein
MQSAHNSRRQEKIVPRESATPVVRLECGDPAMAGPLLKRGRVGALQNVIACRIETEGNSESFREQAKGTKIGSQRSKVQTSELSELIFVFFVAFCSFFLVATRCEQVTKEMAGQEENDAGNSA